jgi:AraC-like DNA-binding protein
MKVDADASGKDETSSGSTPSDRRACPLGNHPLQNRLRTRRRRTSRASETNSLTSIVCDLEQEPILSVFDEVTEPTDRLLLASLDVRDAKVQGLHEIRAAPSLAALAMRCGLSIRTLTRSFRKSRGCTIGVRCQHPHRARHGQRVPRRHAARCTPLVVGADAFQHEIIDCCPDLFLGR